MGYEAIILCGGKGQRLKPHTRIPKPSLKISTDETLVDRQIRWLLEHDFSNIILASNMTFPESAYSNNPAVQTSLEKKKLGTGGAIKKAATLINADQFYAMNVDDIVFYDPRKLFEYASRGAAILVAQPLLLFGKITMQKDMVIRFEQQSTLDIWVNTGHYVFSKKLVEKYFPDQGDFEKETMQKIAGDKRLKGLRYNGDWITVNTMKDLIKAREYFKTRQTKPK